MALINFLKFSIVVIFFNVTLVKCFSEKCKKLEFRCDNGQCIAVEDRCDGIKNCADGSDETVEHCIKFSCPAYAFRCAYGACILRSMMCDNNEDCADGSDETRFLCDTSLGAVEKNKIIQGNCTKPLQMECKSGECIERDSICDGTINCKNGEDETVELCSSAPCKKFAFRCGYGACIAGTRRCDGKMDCADGSDEAIELCTSKEVQQYCFIPQRSNLEIENLSESRKTKSGDRVTYGTRLKFRCKKGYHLVGAMRSVCDTVDWTTLIPHCTKLCSKYELESHLSTTASCAYNGREVSCNGPLFPGTLAQLSCAPGYMLDEKADSLSAELLRCDDEGKWSNQKMRCKPRCGLNKNIVSHGMPWDVSIFRLDDKFEFKCYGTILSPKIVISAQNCFYDIKSADVDEHELYNVVLGNYNESYALNADIKRPAFNVSEINLPYTQKEMESVAVLVLVNFFAFSKSLAPICVQFKKFTTAPYKDISENALKVEPARDFGANIAEIRTSDQRSIYFIVAVCGAHTTDSHLNSLALNAIVKKYIERYENIY